MKKKEIFEYESDWVEYFESILKNEIREEIDNQNKLKANIVESNQSLKELEKKNKNIKIIPSKEKFFHNVKYREKNREYFFYVDTSDPRFWIIHNIENKEKIDYIIKKIFTESYLQDKIYLSQNYLENLKEKTKAFSLGFTLNFNQLFSKFIKQQEAIEDVDYTMQFWPKRRGVSEIFLAKLREIRIPINYKALNFVFVDEDEELDENNILIKEDLYYDGAITIHRGKDFTKHLEFVEKIRSDYREKINFLEEYRTDWENMKGSSYSFRFDKTIDPLSFMKVFNQPSIGGKPNPFRLNVFHLYSELDYHVYVGIDLHTGGKFHVQIFNDRMNIFLDKDSCGNIIARLYTNLQRFFSVSLDLYVDNTLFNL